MLLTYYRITDTTTNTILADKIDNYAFAQETLELYRRDYPDDLLELDSYTYNTVRQGFGRDPDLHT